MITCIANVFHWCAIITIHAGITTGCLPPINSQLKVWFRSYMGESEKRGGGEGGGEGESGERADGEGY